MYVLGRDLMVGDRWQGRTLLGEGERYRVPACVLVACVADEHPNGLAARSFDISSNTPSGRIGCTFFDDELYRVERLE